MQIRRMVMAAIVVVALSGIIALAVQAEDRQPGGEPAYKVTPWPTSSADRQYHEHVERYLNEMASQGWRFHGGLAGQGAKMMLFERLPGK